MSGKLGPITREVIIPKPRQPMSDRWRMAISFGAVFIVFYVNVMDERSFMDVRVGEVGLVRPPERWGEPDVVTYRSWEADSVVVAAAPPGLVNPPAVGTRCRVHGATVVEVRSVYGNDALLMIRGHADRRDGSDLNAEDGLAIRDASFWVDASTEGRVDEVGDCPDGTLFIAGVEQAMGMIRNERDRESRWERDAARLRGRPQDATRLYNVPF